MAIVQNFIGGGGSAATKGAETLDFHGCFHDPHEGISSNSSLPNHLVLKNLQINLFNPSHKNNPQILNTIEIIKKTAGNLLLYPAYTPQESSNENLSQSLNHLMEEVLRLESILLQDESTYQVPHTPDSAALTYMAYTDPVTGLPNRHYFDAYIHKCLRVPEEGFYLIFADIDDFKEVNDTFGHEGGDILLKAIGERLRASLRGPDLVVRYGGDEFVAIVYPPKPGDNASLDIHAVLERLNEVNTMPYEIVGQPRFVTMSFGIAEFPRHGHFLADLLKAADAALYTSKGHGKNRCTIA